MLLLKYEKFGVVDSFVEEIIYKYEKNIGYHLAFDAKGRTALLAMVHSLSESGDDITRVMPALELSYQTLKDISVKLILLKSNQTYVHKTLIETLNKKLSTSTNFALLSEVYRLQRDIGSMQREVESDIDNKVKLVQKGLPSVIFGGSGSDVEESVSLVLDLWTYNSKV